MGIYLSNIEMPKEGCYHRICIYPDGTVPIEGGMYEAIPVQPHGRLIDADALMKRVWEETDCMISVPATFVRDAPTVIPASEEG